METPPFRVGRMSYILEIPREKADEYLNESEKILEYINSSQYKTKEISKIIEQIKKAYEENKMSEVQSGFEKVEQIHKYIQNYEESFFNLKKETEEAERYGIDTPDTKRLIYLAEASFNRGDYKNAFEKVEEAKLMFAVEVKGEFHPVYYVKNHPFRFLIGFFFFGFFGFGSTFLIKLKLYKKKLRILDEEEQLLLQLMRVIQKECFERARMSMEEYDGAMMQYEDRLHKVIQEKIKIETKIAYLFKIKGKFKALESEKKRLIELIKQTQENYLKKGTLETRVYENMLKSYSARLSEVDEEIAVLDAKQAIKKFSKGSLLKNEVKLEMQEKKSINEEEIQEKFEEGSKEWWEQIRKKMKRDTKAKRLLNKFRDKLRKK